MACRLNGHPRAGIILAIMMLKSGWLCCLIMLARVAFGAELAVRTEHPRLLGSRAELQAMAKARPQEFQRTLAVARDASADDYTRGISLALGASIANDAGMAEEARRIAMKLVTGPIRQGHVTFGTDLALCGLIYDLCYERWPEADRKKFYEYFNKTVDANVNSETHVFHNAWYSYKNWGIGIAALATWDENPRAKEIFATLDRDYRTRAAPALEMAGGGGGWAEGYYIHYWSYEWLFFCEIARRAAGLDYFELAPAFYRNRALASAFEMYPGLSDYKTRRPVPMGDGGGRRFGADRDKALAARRILVSYFRDEPTHQALQTYNEQTPRGGAGVNAYKDFLWRDTTIQQRDIKSLPLSHYAPGPGFVYARSSWDEDAAYFFFKAGDRFTAHQHLDNGHFLVYRGAELAGDGGHYEAFGSAHDVNYHLRTIAHSTILVHNPGEKWPAIRGGVVTGNDGGQHHNWPHHNGAVSDPQEWMKNRQLYDIAEVTAFEETGEYLRVAADLTRSYSSNKLERFTREILYLRPATFVVFDEVTATRAEFKKTWLLQAMRPPRQEGKWLIITNGPGQLFLETLLPRDARAVMAEGAELYSYGGASYPPKENTGPAPQARIQISPGAARKTDRFLHVLTAASEPARARLEETKEEIRVWVNDRPFTFQKGR